MWLLFEDKWLFLLFFIYSANLFSKMVVAIHTASMVDKCIKFHKPLLIVCLNHSKILIVTFMYILKLLATFIILSLFVC